MTNCPLQTNFVAYKRYGFRRNSSTKFNEFMVYMPVFIFPKTVAVQFPIDFFFCKRKGSFSMKTVKHTVASSGQGPFEVESNPYDANQFRSLQLVNFVCFSLKSIVHNYRVGLLLIITMICFINLHEKSIL